MALGIQVTYTELSVAMEMVGRSGASGTGAEKKKKKGKTFESCKQTERSGIRHHCIPTHVRIEQVHIESKTVNQNAVELCVLTAGALSHKVREGRRE